MTKETRMLVISAAIMMVLTALVPTALSDGVPPSMDVGPETSSRAYDNDPDNGELWAATWFSSGEVVYGSIMVNQSDDYVDWYVINVPAGSVVNASLYMIEYNASDTAEHDLQLLIGEFGNGPDFIFRDEAWTSYRWETVSHLAPETKEYYILVISNLTWDGQPNTDPTNYTLSVSTYVPTLLPWDATAWGYRDRSNSSNADGWVKISPSLDENERMYALLQSPETGDFDLYAYQIWPHEPSSLFLLNGSNQRDPAFLEYLVIGGSVGDYYLKIDGVSGFGTFGFVVRPDGETIDDDNIIQQAMLVDDNGPIRSSIDQGRDMFDWYKVHLEAGESISKVYLKVEEGNWDLFKVTFFNNNEKYQFHSYNTMNGAWPNDENPTTPTITLTDMDAGEEGDYYILVSTLKVWNWDGWSPFRPASCKYTIEFTLPNEPPRKNKILPKITMDEDTVFTALDLSNYFLDPDGDDLVYSLGGQTDNIVVDVVEDTGEVTIMPAMDWFGTEEVVFRAMDTGPGQKFVEASTLVQVDPVNDPPRLVLGRTIANMTLNESEVVFTEALETVFTDPDNDPFNPLSFRIELLDSNLTPDTALMPLPFYNATLDALEVGPIDLMFGNATFKVTADDNNGSLEEDLPSLNFSITVVHSNHLPRLKDGVDSPIEINLTEGERNDTLWVYDLVEDMDSSYAGDDLTFMFTGQVNIDARVDGDGTLVFDTAGSEYYPGQNYQEDIVLEVEDSAGGSTKVNFTVHVTPVDDPPVFRSFVPSDKKLMIDEGQNVEFKVIVDDVDTLGSMLNYTWFIGSVQQTDEFCSFFSLETDFSSANGLNRTVKVVVTDGTTTIKREWTVDIVDVNRAPEEVRITTPLNASVFKKGKTINFVALAKDKDGDELSYIWYDGDIEIGRGSGFSTKGLKPGFHNVKLIVSDGVNTVNTTVIFEVRRKDSGSEAVPGFGTSVVFCAVTVAFLVKAIGMVRRRRRWAP